MLTLLYGSNSIALRPRTEPTLDLSVAASLSGNIGNTIIGDRLYEPTPLRLECFVVGDLASNISHYMTLVRAVRVATQLQANVQGTLYFRNLRFGGEIQPQGGSIAPKFVYKLILVPAEPWWRTSGGAPVLLWW